MHHRPRRATALFAAILALALPLGALGQSEEPSAEPDASIPQIEGLGWYTSIDVAGAERRVHLQRRRGAAVGRDARRGRRDPR